MQKALSILDQIPSNLPALEKAFQVNRVVTAVGFDWPSQKERWQKVEEELEEVRQEIFSQRKDELELEMGDLLFSLVCVFAAEGVNAERALTFALDKFQKRFCKVEQFANEQNSDLKSLTISDFELLWQRAKLST